jgi:hypothetical protein
MRAADIYRCALVFYPREFREQFSEEMISVFEQRAGEHFAGRELAPFAFLLREFFGIMKGAHVMWLSKFLPVDRDGLRPDTSVSSTATVTASEVKLQRDAAIRNMVAAIAEHDFINARRYSYEEMRLKNILFTGE